MQPNLEVFLLFFNAVLSVAVSVTLAVLISGSLFVNLGL